MTIVLTQAKATVWYSAFAKANKHFIFVITIWLTRALNRKCYSFQLLAAISKDKLNERSMKINNNLPMLMIAMVFLIITSSCKDIGRTSVTKIINERDTIKKYERYRTIFYTASANFTFFKDSINSVKFAIFSYNSTNIKLYQLIEKKWTLTDSVNPGTRVDNINYKILNNDRYLDIVAQTQTNPNDRNIVFIFDEKTMRFIHNSDYDMSNIHYNNMTLSSKTYFDSEKKHWEQTSYKFKENGRKVPYRSYEISISKSFMSCIKYFQYNKGNKNIVKSDSGKVEGLMYSGKDWIEALSKDYHLWYKENLQ